MCSVIQFIQVWWVFPFFSFWHTKLNLRQREHQAGRPHTESGVREPEAIKRALCSCVHVTFSQSFPTERLNETIIAENYNSERKINKSCSISSIFTCTLPYLESGEVWEQQNNWFYSKAAFLQNITSWGPQSYKHNLMTLRQSLTHSRGVVLCITHCKGKWRRSGLIYVVVF